MQYEWFTPNLIDRRENRPPPSCVAVAGSHIVIIRVVAGPEYVQDGLHFTQGDVRECADDKHTGDIYLFSDG